MTDKPIDLENPDSEDRIKKILRIKSANFSSILKLKLMEVSLIEIVAHVISLTVVIPYTILLINGHSPIAVYDTLAKLIFGAYIGNIIRRN